jgi:hypothetical protein
MLTTMPELDTRVPWRSISLRVLVVIALAWVGSLVLACVALVRWLERRGLFFGADVEDRP